MATTGTAIALLVASVVALGCQGDDDKPAPERATRERESPAQTGNGLTKPEFVADANALCAAAKRRAAPISDAIEAMVAREDAAGVAAELRRALPIADELLDEMRALEPPAGDEAAVGRYLDLVAEQKMRIRSLAEAVDAEDLSTIEVVVAELREGNRRAKRVADDYGLTECAPDDLPTG